MIVIGAKGFAKELLDVLVSSKYKYSPENLFFFDDMNLDGSNLLYGEFKIIKTVNEVKEIFRRVSTEFCLGLGSPILREKMTIKFHKLGGTLTSIISSSSEIGRHNTNVGLGCTIIGNAIITNDVNIGRGSLIYMNTSITHDVNIGNFVQISPGVSVLGRSIINNFSFIGANAVILPDITVGTYCTIGAGAVVTKDVPDKAVITGVPAKIVKYN